MTNPEATLCPLKNELSIYRAVYEVQRIMPQPSWKANFIQEAALEPVQYPKHWARTLPRIHIGISRIAQKEYALATKGKLP